MATIQINTYDPEARFNMSGLEADMFFDYIKERAESEGHEVRLVETDMHVDEVSERFVEKCFLEY